MTNARTRQRALKALIDRRFGGVQSRFGSAIGRQADYVSRIVTGKKNLGEKMAREIERLLSLEQGELDREPAPVDVVQLSSAPRFSGAFTPILAWEKLTTWMGDEKKLGSAAVIDYAPRPSGISEAAYALVVRGPAMEPEFRDGWLIYVDETKPAKHGDFVVALPACRATPVLRQLVIDGDVMYLRAVNAAYPDSLIPLGDGKILGRVVYQAKPY